MRNSLAASLVFCGIAVGVTVAPHPNLAESPPDYPIRNGHFFTQGGSSEDRTAGTGYSLTNDDGIPFWDEYLRLGGVDGLGYPISRRFEWQGHVCQVTQKAVLQWNPSLGEVQLVNVFDHLSALGKDDWLERVKRVPRPAEGVGQNARSWEECARAHYALLSDAPISRTFYSGSPDRQARFGLPRSRPQEYDSCFAVRFQRAVLYVWKESVAGMNEGEITIGAAGLIAREAGLFDEAVFTREYYSPVADGGQRGRVLSGGGLTSRDGLRDLYGIATWYGADFQGYPMRNGEIYNMYDPTITACNLFPLDSSLRVTNIHNGYSLVVRVTDTGAFRYPIIVDLSYAAFREIADPASGIAEVTVERLN